MIAAYKGISLISRLIRFRTWSEYSHIAEINEKTGEVIEAWHKGGVVRRSDYHEGHTPGTVIELFDVDTTKVRKRCVWVDLTCEIGKDYDFDGILGFIIRRTRHNTEKWFCSELVFAKYQQRGINLLARVKPHKVSPGLLVMSPRLNYIGFLVVGEDLDHQGHATVRQIAKMREAEKQAAESPVTARGTCTHPHTGVPSLTPNCSQIHPNCSQIYGAALMLLRSILPQRRKLA